MEKVKRNLILTLLAFMLAAVSAVALTVFSYARADEEVKENIVKTVKEKIEDWKKSIGEEEFSKIVAKNTPSDSVDYSTYEKITDETITNLGGIIVAVRDNGEGCNDLSDDVEYVSSNPNLVFSVVANSPNLAFFYGANRDFLSLIFPLEAEAAPLESDESTWVAYYIPSTITFVNSPESLNIDELTFNITNDRTDISYYGVPETSPDDPTPDNPTPDEPGQGTDNPTSGTGENENNNPSASSDKKPSVIGISGIGIVIAIIGIFIFIRKRK